MEKATDEERAIDLYNEANALAEQGRVDEAAATYRLVTETYGDHRDGDVRYYALSAMFNQAVMYGRVERIEEAIAVYHTAFDRYRMDEDRWVRDIVGRAVMNLAGMVYDRDGIDAALEIYRMVEEWCDEASGHDMRTVRVTTLSFKERDLGHAGRHAERKAVCEEIISRFGDDDDETLRFYVAHAAYTRARVLGALGRPEEEVGAYKEWIHRYGEETDERIVAVHANVLAHLMAAG